MPERFEIDFGRLDYPALSPGERDQVRRWVVQRAQADRTEARRRLAGGLAALVRGGAAAVASRWRARLDRRRKRLAAARLKALDDAALKDMGVCRCEIDSIAFAGRG
jgi:uncharacterized protein YjiS (DUF1127 family)